MAKADLKFYSLEYQNLPSKNEIFFKVSDGCFEDLECDLNKR